MKRKMMQFSPELSSRLEIELQKYGYGAEKKKMFGHQTFFLNGYMFCGANVEGIYVHVGQKSADDTIQNQEDIVHFRPREDIVMKDYVLLTKPVYSDPGKLKKWLDRSSAYLLSLPPKIKKAKKR